MNPGPAAGTPPVAELITADLVELDLSADDRHTAARVLAERFAAAGRLSDVDAFLVDVRIREEQMDTGLEGGIGIPHARSSAVLAPALAFGRSTAGIDFGAADGPAHLVFLIGAPAGGDQHLVILAALAQQLVREEFRRALLEAGSAGEVVDLLSGAVLIP